MNDTKTIITKEEPSNVAHTSTAAKTLADILQDLPVDWHECKMMDTNIMAKNTTETYIRTYEIVSGMLIKDTNTKAITSMMW